MPPAHRRLMVPMGDAKRIKVTRTPINTGMSARGRARVRRLLCSSAGVMPRSCEGSPRPPSDAIHSRYRSRRKAESSLRQNVSRYHTIADLGRSRPSPPHQDVVLAYCDGVAREGHRQSSSAQGRGHVLVFVLEHPMSLPTSRPSVRNERRTHLAIPPALHRRQIAYPTNFLALRQLHWRIRPGRHPRRNRARRHPHRHSHHRVAGAPHQWVPGATGIGHCDRIGVGGTEIQLAG
jgi:hypothetical protein